MTEDEDVNGVDIDFRIVDIDTIEPNDYNPNEVEVSLFETLVATVKEEGMNQPVLVRPKPGDAPGSFVPDRYIIVDGENRWTAAKIAGLSEIGVVVVNYDETTAKLRTLSYNAIKGTNVPLKLARLVVDLQRTYSDKEIRSLTGIAEDEQKSVLRLLDVPDFKPDDGIRIPAQRVDRPIQVSLMLMPDEVKHYTASMKKAMKMAGEEVTVLIGNEVQDYDNAMTTAMGLAGMKLRNVALAVICRSFLDMPKAQQTAAADAVKRAMMDKRVSDATAKERQAAKTDKAKPAVQVRRMGSRPVASPRDVGDAISETAPPVLQTPPVPVATRVDPGPARARPRVRGNGVY